MNKAVLKYIKIVLTLCLITAIVGALLALVNAVTKDKIAENNKIATNEAIASIFGVCEATGVDQVFENELVSAVYVVKAGAESEFVGYCVLVTPKGYGGKMELMVGLTPDGAVKGISVVSHEETSGIGTKVLDNESYYSQYYGMANADDCASVDAISGASRSSKALADGVKAALSLGLGVSLTAEEVSA